MLPTYSGIFIHILEPVARQLYISRLLAGAERTEREECRPDERKREN